VFTGFAGTEEEVILFADGTRSNFVFDEVVVGIDTAVVQIGVHATGGGAGVVESLAISAFGNVAAAKL
jgi:hypothetical protein